MAKIQGYSEDDVDLLISDFEKVVNDAIFRTLRTVANNLHGAIVADASSAGLSTDDIHIITSTWQDEVDGTLNPYIAEVYTGSATSVAIGLGEAFPDGSTPGVPLVADEFSVTYMKTVTNRLTDVSNELWEEVRNELLDGIAQGQGIPQIRNRIMALHGYTEQRATTIARTEIHGAAESGSIAQMRYVGYTDDDTTKEWLATIGDGRTRRTHILANEQKVRLSEKFVVGGSLLDHPGVAGAPADEVIQCRCTMIFDTEAEPKFRCNSPLLAAAAPTATVCVVPIKPADVSYFSSAQLHQIFKEFISHKITPAWGGAKIHKVIGEVRTTLKNSSNPADQALEAIITERQIVAAVDKFYSSKKDTFTTKYVQWAESATGKKTLKSVAPPVKAVKVPIVPEPDPIPPTLLQPPSQSKFKILDDPGKSGDGYAPGGQWGKYGSSGVLIRAKDEVGVARFLLIQRGALYQGSQKFKWQLPGGGADKNEGPYEAAARELWEETQASKEYVESMTPLGEMVYDGGLGWKYTSIVAHADSTFTPKVHGSTGDAKWFTLDEIKAMLDNGDIVKELSPTLGQLSDELDQLAITKMVEAPKLPSIATKPKPWEIQFTGKTLGSHGAQVWENVTTHDRWLFKPQDKFATDLDIATAKIQSKAFQTRPGVYEMELNGQKGSIQFMFESKDAWPNGSFNPVNLSTEDLVTIQETQIFDWMISNFDTHSGQWIRLADDTLFETDKGQAFKFFGKDKLSWDYVPVTPLGNDKLTYVPLWRAFIEGKDVALQDPTTGPLGEYIDRLIAIDDKTYRDLLMPYASHWKSGKALEDFLDAAVARKNNLKKDFGDFYAKATTERAKKIGSPKPVKIATPEPELIIPPIESLPVPNVSKAVTMPGDSSMIPAADSKKIIEKWITLGGGKKVTPAWGGAKIFKMVQELKKDFPTRSDLQLLRLLDEQGGFVGKAKTYEGEVVKWLQTPGSTNTLLKMGITDAKLILGPAAKTIDAPKPKVEPVLPVKAVIPDEATDVLATGTSGDANDIFAMKDKIKEGDVIAYADTQFGQVRVINAGKSGVLIEIKSPGQTKWKFNTGTVEASYIEKLYPGVVWKFKLIKTGGLSKIRGKLPNDVTTPNEIWESRFLWDKGDIIVSGPDKAVPDITWRIVSDGEGNMHVEYSPDQIEWKKASAEITTASNMKSYFSDVDFHLTPDVLNSRKPSHIAGKFVGDKIEASDLQVVNAPPDHVFAYAYSDKAKTEYKFKTLPDGTFLIEFKPAGFKHWVAFAYHEDIKSNVAEYFKNLEWYAAKINGDAPDSVLSLMPGAKSSTKTASRTLGVAKSYITGKNVGDKVTAKEIFASQYNSPPPGTILAEPSISSLNYRIVYDIDDTLHLYSYNTTMGKWIDSGWLAEKSISYYSDHWIAGDGKIIDHSKYKSPPAKKVAAKGTAKVAKTSKLPPPIETPKPTVAKTNLIPGKGFNEKVTSDEIIEHSDAFIDGKIIAYGKYTNYSGVTKEYRIFVIDGKLVSQKKTAAGSWTSTKIINAKWDVPYGPSWLTTSDHITPAHLKSAKKSVEKLVGPPVLKTPLTPKSYGTPSTPAPSTVKIEPLDLSEWNEPTQELIVSTYKQMGASSSNPEGVWIALQSTKAKLKKLHPTKYDNVSDLHILRMVDAAKAKKYGTENVHNVEIKVLEWLKTPAGRIYVSKRIDAPIAAGDVPEPMMDMASHSVPPDKQEYKIISSSDAVKYQDEALAKYGAWRTGEKTTLKKYTGGGSSTWNAAIRSGDLGSSRAEIFKQQGAMRPSTRPMLLARGTSFAELNDRSVISYETLLPYVGHTYVTRGFTSTSVGGKAAFGGQLLIEIEAPVGTPMAHVAPFSNFKSERETTLAAHLIYEILGVTKKDAFTTVMRVRVIGAAKK